MQTLTVALRERSYPIHVEQGLLDRAGELVKQAVGACKCVIVTDTNVAPLYLTRVLASLEQSGLHASFIVLKAGEPTKSMASLRQIYDYLCDQEFTRTDAIIALGGGVMGDLAGLAAATFLRGVPFIQIPTSLLAQVDSSVGGKVAVDLPQGKNLVGAFYQPRLVLIDPDTLLTLSDPVWRDGLGEVVKYGCIGDDELFSLLEDCAPGGRAALMARIGEVLMHCLKAKAKVVEEDEQDNGSRMILNFGHTLGHAVETVQHYGGLRHGEAVALGMAMITRRSERLGQSEPGTSARLEALLSHLGLPLHAEVKPEALLTPMRMDKKNRGDTLRIILLDRIGACRVEKVHMDWFDGLAADL